MTYDNKYACVIHKKKTTSAYLDIPRIWNSDVCITVRIALLKYVVLSCKKNTHSSK